MFNKAVLLSLMLLLAGTADARPMKRCKPKTGVQPAVQPGTLPAPPALPPAPPAPPAGQEGAPPGAPVGQGAGGQPAGSAVTGVESQPPAAQGIAGIPTTATNTTGGGGGKPTTKRGFSIPGQQGDAKFITQFFGDGAKTSWFYNWAPDYAYQFGGDASLKPANADYYPMVHGAKDVQDDPNYPEGSQVLLGFNEPDNTNADTGSNMDAKSAVGDWKRLVDGVKRKYPNMQFASPSMAGDRNWQKTFMTAICPSGLSGCEYAPQYLAVHDYQKDPNGIIDNLKKWHEEYPELPIILSEFACVSFDPNEPKPSDDEVNKFMDTLIPFLDETEWIYRYAWFTAAADAGALFGVSPNNLLIDANSQITELGRKYISM